MKISIVAGVAGFLGSHLADSLLSLGHEVIGIDNLSTSDGSNLAKLQIDKKFSVIKARVDKGLDDLPINSADYIFHFASPASPPKYQKLALETLHANTLGTENLIKLSLKLSSRFVYASTSEIYGDPLVSPQHENYWGNVNPIGPRSVYDESKRLGETLVYHYAQREGLRGSIIRIFNTYGPGMDPYDGRVVSTFIRQALKKEAFTVFGDGMQTRSFCYVSDLMQGITLLAESEHFGPINLGNPSEISLIKLGETIAEALGIEARFDFKELPEDDPKHRKPDISRAGELLGWTPSTPLLSGINKTATWMRLMHGL